MKKTFYKISMLICSLLLFTNFTINDNVCIIKGELIGVESKSIILLKTHENLRFDGIEIPIKDGKFEFEMRINQSEGYKLMLGEAKQNGGGKYTYVFIEPGEINITVHAEKEFDKNVVTGGELNLEYYNFINEMNNFKLELKSISTITKTLREDENYFSDEMNNIRTDLMKAATQDEKTVIYKKKEELEKANLHLTDDGKKIAEKKNEIYKKLGNALQNHISQNHSIVSYFMLLEFVLPQIDRFDLSIVKKEYQILSLKYPNHTYTKIARNLLLSFEKIKIGGKYIDFSIPDLNNKNFQLSELIKDKVALINLWATWCGPCIAKSRKMIPIYQEFKDLNFTVVGIAGEFKNTDKLIKFLKKEKYPWVNLLELDRQNSIWEKYGIQNSGGGMFLVDKQGTILAIDPTDDELRTILNDLLI